MNRLIQVAAADHVFEEGVVVFHTFNRNRWLKRPCAIISDWQEAFNAFDLWFFRNGGYRWYHGQAKTFFMIRFQYIIGIHELHELPCLIRIFGRVADS
ncbi:hypothetical protein D3C85_1558060 [compost metagenome]